MKTIFKNIIIIFIILGLSSNDKAFGIGELSNIKIVLLKYKGGNFKSRPTALRRLAWETAKRTSIEIETEITTTTPSTEILKKSPLVFIQGDSAFEPFTDNEINNLRKYIESGGTIVADTAFPDKGFKESFINLIKQIMPNEKLKPIPKNHVLWHSFYMINAPVGRVINFKGIKGLYFNNRLGVIFSENDLLGNYERDNLGNWKLEVEGGEGQRELAFRMGINILMYALCVDYKDDQVHLPFIMNRTTTRLRGSDIKGE